MPDRLTSPSVGLIPTTPQALAGQTIDPSVSVPTASGARSAAIPAAEPELDPDGLRSSAYGLAVWPPSVDHPLVPWVDLKFAHSERFALPMITAPAWRSLRTMNASPACASSSAGEPAVAGIPAAWMLSLTRTGIPSSGLRGPRRVRAASLARASPGASGFTVMTACSAGFSRLIRSR
jgi:hypothetical protein